MLVKIKILLGMSFLFITYEFEVPSHLEITLLNVCYI